MDPSLFTRDGHLQDLALERLVLDDLAPTEAQAVRGHIASCPACAQRHRAIAAEMAEPLPELATAAPAPQRRGFVIPAGIMRLRWFMGGVGAAVAAAAAILVVMLPSIGPDLDPEFRVRGGALVFEVYREDADGAVRLQHGDRVHEGDVLGFRVASREAGNLLVLGIDSSDTPYPCYPSDPTVGPKAWAVARQPVQLDAAIRLDATPGQERLVALLCEEPVGFDTLALELRSAAAGLDPWADLPELHPGCLQRELRLSKLEGLR